MDENELKLLLEYVKNKDKIEIEDPTELTINIVGKTLEMIEHLHKDHNISHEDTLTWIIRRYISIKNPLDVSREELRDKLDQYEVRCKWGERFVIDGDMVLMSKNDFERFIPISIPIGEKEDNEGS